jgi:hypothetical protein
LDQVSVKGYRKVAAMNEVRGGGLGLYELTGRVAVVTGGSGGIGAAAGRCPGRRSWWATAPGVGKHL